jgi:hypothetical protein
MVLRIAAAKNWPDSPPFDDMVREASASDPINQLDLGCCRESVVRPWLIILNANGEVGGKAMKRNVQAYFANIDRHRCR